MENLIQGLERGAELEGLNLFFGNLLKLSTEFRMKLQQILIIIYMKVELDFNFFMYQKEEFQSVDIDNIYLFCILQERGMPTTKR